MVTTSRPLHPASLAGETCLPPAASNARCSVSQDPWPQGDSGDLPGPKGMSSRALVGVAIWQPGGKRRHCPLLAPDRGPIPPHSTDTEVHRRLLLLPGPTPVSFRGGRARGHLLCARDTHVYICLMCKYIFLFPAETTVPAPNPCHLCWEGEVGVREPLNGG